MPLDGTPSRNTFREINPETPSVWSQYPVASWTVQGSPVIAFPVIEMNEIGGSRIVRRHRAYRNGSKCDDTGSKEKGWDLVVKFSNEVNEPGLENNGMPLYPDALRLLIESSDLYHDEAGDLVLPHRGPVRARFEAYRWAEKASERECATLVFTFVEDNEDNVDAASYSYPSVQANATELVLDVVDQTEDIDAYDKSTLTLRGFTNDLAALINAPANIRRDLDQQTTIVMSAIDTVISSFSKTGEEGRDQFTKPDSDPAVRSLILLKDTVGRERYKSGRGRRRLISVAFNTDRSLMSVSVQYKQPYADLLEVNASQDPLLIPAGTPIKIFASV